MDDGQFDIMTRGVSTLLSRRTLAGALGLSVLGPERAEARNKRKCGPCRKCHLQKGKCKPKRAGTPAC